MKIIFVLIFSILLGCKEKDNFHDAEPMNYQFVDDYNNKEKIDKLCKRVVVDGDTLAFRELKYIYMISEHSEEFLYFSTFMAEKYNYGPAYQTNYDILKDFKQSTMQKMAVYNLIRAYELGNKNNVIELNEMFPKGIPKSEEYW